MDGGKGIHAIGTSVFIFLVVYLTWPFIDTAFANIGNTTVAGVVVTDTLMMGILWTVLIVNILLNSAVAPWLIATQEETESNIASSLLSFGFMAGSVFLFSISAPLFTAFGNILSGTLERSIFYFFEVALIAIMGFIIPTMISLMPHSTLETVKS